ncbi:MAG: tRNA (adenine-N(1)-)-methyltransferase catalytic subunit trm61 [Cirrosporium novae-zelandiae]|nr:MAG: tRNA (adenine-N(1)-)-methyltransferase catalytic subunit trm61 [Cirrosporium novae-zelandiae]
MATPHFTPSPFFDHGPTATDNTLSLLHLSRDALEPLILHSQDVDNEGYSEGKVTNTRFGSFPHSTLIGTPWGSQVLASKVDTGTRGRRNPGVKSKKSLKRKRNNDGDGDNDASTPMTGDNGDNENVEYKKAVAASSGFAHLLPPTPESWTSSLPHRTQVVYTPDYSYILHRLRARPGSVLIEAGAGSGSFTHAAARAVFNGYPSSEPNPQEHPESSNGLPQFPPQKKRKHYGHVYSYEFHLPRSEKIREELQEHAIDSIVTVTHRDVCNDGFLLPSSSPSPSSDKPSISPKATAVFLDLPAPWLALRNLTRASPSPLSSTHPVHVCCFIPCIEQATKTVNTLRQLNWTSISMVALSAHRIEVRRERVGLREVDGPQRGVVNLPKDVSEALGRLREQEERARKSREIQVQANNANGGSGGGEPDDADEVDERPMPSKIPAPEPLDRPLYSAGTIIHRSEPDLKTHTSFLVFAVLPAEWTQEDEERCAREWPVRAVNSNKAEKDGKKKWENRVREDGKMSKRAIRRAEKERKKKEEEKVNGDGDVDVNVDVDGKVGVKAEEEVGDEVKDEDGDLGMVETGLEGAVGADLEMRIKSEE